MTHRHPVLQPLLFAALIALTAPIQVGAQQAPGASGSAVVAAPVAGAPDAGAPRLHARHGMHDGHRMHDGHAMHDGHGKRGDGMSGDGMRGHGMRDEMREMGMGDGMRMLRGLNLTEAQRDQVFGLMHQQIPAMRERAKAMHKSRQELQALARSPQFDEARAKSLADGIAGAMAEMAMSRARAASAIYQLLTPEQRRQADEQRERRERRAPSGAGPAMK